MQLQLRIVATDAELLVATVSMAIVMKSKNPRMRRPLGKADRRHRGYNRTWLGPRESVSGAAWRAHPTARTRGMRFNFSAVTPVRTVYVTHYVRQPCGASSEPGRRACNPLRYAVLFDRP